MCGIAGAINTDPYRIAQQQVHRGPDNLGHSGILAHNRLAIIDLSEKGNQPMTAGSLQMTFNGEIYNYQYLNSYLGSDDLGGHKVPGDAAVFLKYIQRFGLKKALSEANGMWAFGLFNGEEITLCVDRMGQKPLYYYQEGDVFAFASSPAGLLHLKDKWRINEEAKQTYFLLGGVMKDSIFDGIKRVHAGELVTYNTRSKQIKSEVYWRPSFISNTVDIEELTLHSIKQVKVADVPVYIFLSGGIDSSVVASQFQGGGAIHMDGPEKPYAETVAEKFRINLHTVSPVTADPVQVMTDYVTKCGEPSMSGIIPYLVSREAAKMCKVAVTANGADELFFGYDRTTDKVSQQQIRHIFRGVPSDYLFYYGDIDERLSSGRWMELMTYVQHDLNRTLDFASMAHSLEVRSPFLDHRLVEMALSIPQEKHGRKEILKNILRKHGFTEEFLNRPKMGFSLYKKPENYEELQDEAFEWCVMEGYILEKYYSARDRAYLRAAAFGFWVWWGVFKEKLS